MKSENWFCLHGTDREESKKENWGSANKNKTMLANFIKCLNLLMVLKLAYGVFYCVVCHSLVMIMEKTCCDLHLICTHILFLLSIYLILIP